MESLLKSDWTSRRELHRARLLPVVTAHRERKRRAQPHPVYDFLFSYYSFSAGQLLRWTPGAFVQLEVDRLHDFEWPAHLSASTTRERGYFQLSLNRFPAERVPFLRWGRTLLAKTLDRPPLLCCFGLHEWAMVYKDAAGIRHGAVPLRLPRQACEDVVEQSAVRCTHYDAFRFFTAEARPLNRHRLTPDSVHSHEQPGCIHANMDLYRLGYKIAPYVCSELLAELFMLARSAREVDMRASPYDLSQFGFSPIKIETSGGREEYVNAQRNIFLRAQVLRKALLGVYEQLLSAKAPGAEDIHPPVPEGIAAS